MNLNPKASFDILALLCKTQKQLNNASETEIHLLSYLACLLSVYKKQPVSDWGYDFYCTHGYPFSSELSNSLSKLMSLGYINKKSEFYYANELTKKCLDDFSGLKENQKRLPYIEAVCAAVLSLPIGTIREALINEPAFSDKKKSGGPRPIFDSGGLENLYEQFSVISDAVGVHISDLIVPAIVWISYLSTIQE